MMEYRYPFVHATFFVESLRYRIPYRYSGRLTSLCDCRGIISVDAVGSWPSPLCLFLSVAFPSLNPDFHSSGKMMLNLSSALGRLVLSGRELARLSGFSSRVTGLMDVIEDVNGGVHQRRGYQPSSPVRREVWGDASEASTSASGDVDSVAAGDTRDAEGDSPTGRDHGRTQVGEGGRSASGDRVSNPLSSAVKPGDHRLPGGAAGLETPSPTSGGSGQDGIRSMMGQPELAPEVGIPGVAGDLEAVHEEGGGMVSSPDVNRVMEGNGRPTRQGSVVVKEDRVIEFQEVPLVTPSGDVLIKSLSFKVMD